jgi:hypothetical protein
VGGSNSDTVFYSDRIGYPGAPPPWFASNTEAESVAGGLRFLMKTIGQIGSLLARVNPEPKTGLWIKKPPESKALTIAGSTKLHFLYPWC